MHNLKLLLCFLISEGSFCQVNVISPETMYNGSGGINGDAIVNWEANDRFENDALIMSGTGDMRNTSPSGYSGASGSWNVMLNAAGEYFMINGIDASGYSNLKLSLGVRKSTLSENGSGLLAECSADGTNWASLSIVLLTGTGSSGWHFVQVNGNLPSSPSLSLRFTSLNAVEFRLDDLQLKGILPCSTAITSFFPASGPAGTQVIITGSGFTGAVQVLFHETPAITFQILSDSVIIATTPFGADSGPISILTSCSMSSLINFEIIRSSCALNGSNLILSELCDPMEEYETDRYIEIFNPTSHAIDLNGWSVRAIANYSECETWNLSGIIQPGEALTCGYINPSYGGPHDFTLPAWDGRVTGSCCSFWNGNRRDGAALYQGLTKIDIGLFENSSIGWFSDRSLIRMDTICRPNPTESPGEWVVSTQVTTAGSSPSSPGLHFTHCPGMAPGILVQPVSQQICEGSEVTFMVSVSWVSDFQFQWMTLDSSGNWQAVSAVLPCSISSDSTSSNLRLTSISPGFDQKQFYCRVLTSNGGCWTASSVAILTVIPLPATSGIFHY
jgi:hypothetical protein